MRNPMKLAVLTLVLAMSFALGSEAGAAPPAQWSLQRGSLGFDAKALVTDGNSTSQFAPGIYLSYSAASNLSLATTLERSMGDHLTIWKAGARVRVLDTQRGDIAGGVDYVNYSDEGAANIAKPSSYAVGIHGAWDAIRAKNGRTYVWAIGSVSYDPDNAIKMFRVGLRFQAIGGVPVYEPDTTQ